MESKSSLLHTIREEGFIYHVIKGELKKGSVISKKIHPVKEVNEYRENLKKRGAFSEYNNYYKLKKTVRVGALMAYNLYKGELVTKPAHEAIIRTNDKKIIEDLDLENIYPTDSVILNYENMDSMKLEAIYDVDLEFSELSNQDPNEFSNIETLFFETLKKEGIISKDSRHGLTEKKECDIVDEKNKLQIEIVTEFKNRIIKDKHPQRNIEMFLFEAVANNITFSSQALINKFCSKDYTNKYAKELGIFCLGNFDSIKVMISTLNKTLKDKNIKNDFRNIYLIWYDFIDDKTYLFKSNDNSIKELKDKRMKVFKKTEIDYTELKENKKYLIILKNIFSGERAIGYFSREEIKERIKTLHVKVK